MSLLCSNVSQYYVIFISLCTCTVFYGCSGLLPSVGWERGDRQLDFGGLSLSKEQ